ARNRGRSRKKDRQPRGFWQQKWVPLAMYGGIFALIAAVIAVAVISVQRHRADQDRPAADRSRNEPSTNPRPRSGGDRAGSAPVVVDRDTFGGSRLAVPEYALMPAPPPSESKDSPPVPPSKTRMTASTAEPRW